MTEDIPKEDHENTNSENGEDFHSITHLSGMYQDWFLDYASYVILERAVPAIEDGLKPVQRRILHSMWELEDGRYNKVANIIGNTMKYHPHGDASIGDAMVQIGQKDLLIDMQGNWGNIYTGDSAAAPRYIEARLSKFGQEVVFNPKTTEWGLSYDGRNKEPITLPVKFPLLLAQGVEGIAVGLACKILPHNFNELIDASVKSLQGKKTNIVPDFPTGGLADFSLYNDGLRGGKIRVRARINMLNKKTLSITEIPFGTTTTSLIDSILAANDKGKIKVRKIEDNTAELVEILIHLSADVSPDKTIDALYAFTDCEVSISPNACIIGSEKPRFVGVNEMLKISTQKTLDLLKLELQIEKKELEEKWHFSSLEKIFIKEEMYIDFKKYDNKEKLFAYLYNCFKRHRKNLLRDIIDEDLEKLCQIPMIRITRFDSAKADDFIAELEDKIKAVKRNLNNLVEYAIDYFKGLKEKYGEGRERKTEIRSFENIEAKQVVVINSKLYVNREEGFAGFGMRKDEFVCDCSDLDDIIAFSAEGKMKVMKIAEKSFFGKDIIHIAVFKKNDEATIYNMVYRDGLRGVAMMKRFSVTGITRDKEYDLTRGNDNSKVLYFSATQGESEIVTVFLKPLPGIRKLEFDLNFAELAVKGRSVQGNVVTKLPVKKIVLKKKGQVEVKAGKIWFDDTVHRLNTEEKGTYLGEFLPDDKILYVTQSGHYRVTGFELSTHFDEDILLIEKFDMSRPLSCIYYDAGDKCYMVKRFVIEAASNNKVLVIAEEEGSRMEIVTTDANPEVEVLFRDKGKRNKKVKLAEFIDVKGWKAKGNKLSDDKIKEINLVSKEERDLSARTENEAEKETPAKAEKKAKKENKKEEKKPKKGKGGKAEQGKLF